MKENDFHQLQQENTTLREENASLRASVAELRAQVKHLEERLSKTSKNSHLPPSSDRFARQPKTRSLRQKSDKQPGAQAGHEGNTLSQTATPDQVIVHEVHTCATCQHNLGEEPSLQVERRQVWDVPPKRLVVIEHQAEQKCCPHCQQITKAAFPDEVSAPVQYGPALSAIGVYLVQAQFLPYERACETMEELLGPAMTVGTLKAAVERCAKQLQPMQAQIKEALRQSPVIHVDETGLYVMGKRFWLHTVVTPTLTFYAVHPKRGGEAMCALGVLDTYAGVAVHDGWGAYWHFLCEHALCNVHHLRELLFLQQQERQAWAEKMSKLLERMNETVKQAREQGLSQLTTQVVTDYTSEYQAILQEGWQANPLDSPPIASASKRGRPKQSAARNLLHRLSKHQDAVLRFLQDFRVPFDNNQAERDIRMVKVQQKISGCFRRLAGAQDFCCLRGYISTMRKQRGQLLTALELALTGHPVSPSF